MGKLFFLFVDEFIKGWSPVTFSVYLVHIMVDYSQVQSIIKYPKL